MIKTVKLFILVLFAFSASDSFGQKTNNTNSDAVKQVDNLYHTGKLDDAELRALRLLSSPGDFDSVERSELYRILAFISIARDDRDRGSLWFKDALSENPQLHLDQTFTSPKILSVFNRAKSEFELSMKSQSKIDVSELYLYRIRTEAGIKSIIFPGSGQLHKGHKKRGIAFIGAASLSAVGLITSEILLRDRKDKYQSATLPEVAASRYDDYKLMYQVRNSMAITLGVIWSASILEAFISMPNSKLSKNIQLGVQANPDNALAWSLGVKYTF